MSNLCWEQSIENSLTTSTIGKETLIMIKGHLDYLERKENRHHHRFIDLK